jgi:predicted ATP-grasp superfamily ATP-dependent carboligase
VLGDLDLVRPLALAGVRCALVAPPGAPSRHSRFVAEVLDAPQDWGEPGDFLDDLLRWGRGQAQPPVLYYQDDTHLLFVARNRDRLAGTFRFVVADPDRVEELVDKARFAPLAMRLGLPLPDTRVLSPAGSAPPSDLAFPLLVKPLYRDHGRWHSVSPTAKALRVDEPAQLAALWPALAAAGGDLLAQAVIPGPETRIESYHSYVDTHGQRVAEFTGRKIRTRPVEYGHTTALTLTGEPDVLELGREVVRALELVGVAKVDFKRGPDGVLHLLEVNPRFNLWHHAAAVAGVNLPALVYADLTGGARPPVTTVRSGVRWCSESDAGAARAWGVPFPQWLRWAVACETKQVWAWNDPVPFLRLAGTRLRDRLPTGRSSDATRPAPPSLVGGRTPPP